MADDNCVTCDPIGLSDITETSDINKQLVCDEAFIIGGTAPCDLPVELEEAWEKLCCMNESFIQIMKDLNAKEIADDAAQEKEIEQEIKDRVAGDKQLQTNIDNEAKARENADNGLQTDINNIKNGAAYKTVVDGDIVSPADVKGDTTYYHVNQKKISENEVKFDIVGDPDNDSYYLTDMVYSARAFQIGLAEVRIIGNIDRAVSAGTFSQPLQIDPINDTWAFPSNQGIIHSTIVQKDTGEFLGSSIISGNGVIQMEIVRDIIQGTPVHLDFLYTYTGDIPAS